MTIYAYIISLVSYTDLKLNIVGQLEEVAQILQQSQTGTDEDFAKRGSH